MDSPPSTCRPAPRPGKVRQELVTLALIKLAQGDADNAARSSTTNGHALSPRNHWVWA